jgi:nucleoside-diphosphate-sugar epimerase
MRNPLAEDLDHVLARSGDLWEGLRGARVFLTGGTGFFGCWLLETLLWANERLALDASVVVLTRNVAGFRTRVPQLAGHPAITLQQGDVCTFAFMDGAFTHVIHAAVDAVPPVTPVDCLRVFDIIVAGTRRALEFAHRSGAGRFLLTSSGGVYGRQPPDLTHMPEEHCGGPDPADARNAGAEAKRAAETLCAVHADGQLATTIARCFAFVGPYLPLDAHLAAGNFIGDALRGGPIRVTGDGTPHRSYMYASDLAVWLWTILLRGQSARPYNVGSADTVTIKDLAHLVADAFAPSVQVLVARTPVAGARADRYVPAVARAETELGVRQTVSLPDGIRRTVAWHRKRGAYDE